MAALLPIIEATGIDPDAVLRACRQAQTAGQFRELLDFEFARFNESLLASGSEPLTYPTVHASQLLNHLVDNEVSILDALRNEAAPRLDRLEPAPEYAQRRDNLRSLTGPDWLTRYHIVPDEALADRVTAWLTSLGTPQLGTNPHSLPTLSEVIHNLRAIGRFAFASAPVVRAWWRGPSVSLPEFWREGKAAAAHSLELDGAGVHGRSRCSGSRVARGA